LASSCRPILLLLILCGFALPGGMALAVESASELDEVVVNGKQLA
jgi:hypothetical protein